MATLPRYGKHLRAPLDPDKEYLAVSRFGHEIHALPHVFEAWVCRDGVWGYTPKEGPVLPLELIAAPAACQTHAKWNWFGTADRQHQVTCEKCLSVLSKEEKETGK